MFSINFEKLGNLSYFYKKKKNLYTIFFDIGVGVKYDSWKMPIL
jgi:hypothetical protein